MSANSPHRWQLTLGQRLARGLSNWMPVAFIGIIASLVIVGVVKANALTAQPAVSATENGGKSNDDSAKSAAELKETISAATLKAEELKSKIDDLKWILELILGASGLFTIAQGIAAGFSAKSFSDQAEGMLAEAKARFTVFSLLEDRRKSADAYLASLERSLASNSPVSNPDEGFSWQRRFYEKMPLATRQELLSAEQIFPYVVAGQTDPTDVYARNLRYLSQFYWAKFVYERERGLGSLEDIERARYLLDLAIRKIGSVFYLLNDMGNIHLEYYKVLKAFKMPSGAKTAPSEYDLAELRDALNRACQSFDDSIRAERKQLRAYYNLACIARMRANEIDSAQPNAVAEKNKLLTQAIEFSIEGLKYPNWERKPVKDYRCSAWYNLACSYALLEPADQLKCFESLKEAAAIGLISPVDAERDFHEPEGDFYKLLQTATPEYKQKFEPLEKALAQNFR